MQSLYECESEAVYPNAFNEDIQNCSSLRMIAVWVPIWQILIVFDEKTDVEAHSGQVWKDVDGVLTCNPSIYGKALPVPFLTFEEASELAYFGAQVLFPQTIVTEID